MGVSKNSGETPKSSILIGFSIINHPFWDTTIFGNTQICNPQKFKPVGLLGWATFYKWKTVPAQMLWEWGIHVSDEPTTSRVFETAHMLGELITTIPPRPAEICWIKGMLEGPNSLQNHRVWGDQPAGTGHYNLPGYIPKHSRYDISTYIWILFIVNVGKCRQIYQTLNVWDCIPFQKSLRHDLHL